MKAGKVRPARGQARPALDEGFEILSPSPPPLSGTPGRHPPPATPSSAPPRPSSSYRARLALSLLLYEYAASSAERPRRPAPPRPSGRAERPLIRLSAPTAPTAPTPRVCGMSTPNLAAQSVSATPRRHPPRFIWRPSKKTYTAPPIPAWPWNWRDFFSHNMAPASPAAIVPGPARPARPRRNG